MFRRVPSPPRTWLPSSCGRPPTPGGIGVIIEASLIVALTAAGAQAAPAAAAVLVYRLLSCWSVLPIGLLCRTTEAAWHFPRNAKPAPLQWSPVIAHVRGMLARHGVVRMVAPWSRAPAGSFRSPDRSRPQGSGTGEQKRGAA
jgi:hypothetical protein